MRFRTLRTIAIIVGVGIPALVALSVAHQRPMPLGVLLFGGAVGVGAGSALYALAQHRLRTRYLAATRSDDARTLRRAFEELVDAHDGNAGPLALQEAAVLARERRFTEGVARLDAVDPRTRSRHEGYYLVLRAFCIAHLGQAAAALPQFDEAAARVTDPQLRKELPRLRGIVLTLAGRHAEALKVLTRAEARAGTSFYLAEAHRGVGDIDAAIASYERVLALPEGDPLREAARVELEAVRSRRAFR